MHSQENLRQETNTHSLFPLREKKDMNRLPHYSEETAANEKITRKTSIQTVESTGFYDGKS